jgi:hypothetical protein
VATDGWDYNTCGLGAWATRQKMGGKYRHAPIMSDRLQATGTWNLGSNSGMLNWTDSDGGQSVQLANHWDAGAGGVPNGGNFLFEDGRVNWFKFLPKNPRGSIDAGSIWNGWVLFYKPATISIN